jgi:hypothetical protein
MGATTAVAGKPGRRRVVSVLAGAAMIASVAVAAPAAAGDAQPAASAISITPVPGQVKSASGCKYIFWTVNVSGMPDPSDYRISTRAVRSGDAAVVGSLVDGIGTLRNGANRVRGKVCATENRVGPYRASATLNYKGKALRTAEPVSFGVRVTPTVGFSGIGGEPGVDAWISGYATPVIDVRGKTVSLFFKKEGTTKYIYLGTETFDSNGFFRHTSKSINDGWIYASVKQQGFVLPARTPSLHLEGGPSSITSAQLVG